MTAANDADAYRKMIGRIARLIVVIGLAGTVAAALAKGVVFGFGFLLGAMLSAASFWRWKKVADSLGRTDGPSPKGRSAMKWVLRFALLIGIAYVIVQYLEVPTAAVFFGLLVSAAAVVVSIIYELIYGT